MNQEKNYSTNTLGVYISSTNAELVVVTLAGAREVGARRLDSFPCQDFMITSFSSASGRKMACAGFILQTTQQTLEGENNNG